MESNGAQNGVPGDPKSVEFSSSNCTENRYFVVSESTQKCFSEDAKIVDSSREWLCVKHPFRASFDTLSTPVSGVLCRIGVPFILRIYDSTGG